MKAVSLSIVLVIALNSMQFKNMHFTIKKTPPLTDTRIRSFCDNTRTEAIANRVKKITWTDRSFYNSHNKKYICLNTFACAMHISQTNEFYAIMPVYWSTSSYGRLNNSKDCMRDSDICKAVYEELERRFEGK